jgi:hypothetical protein
MVLLPYSFKCRFMVPFVSELATQLLEKSWPLKRQWLL